MTEILRSSFVKSSEKRRVRLRSLLLKQYIDDETLFLQDRCVRFSPGIPAYQILDEHLAKVIFCDYDLPGKLLN